MSPITYETYAFASHGDYPNSAKKIADFRDSILSSRPFRFLVGPQKREFTLHSAVVAHQSKALDRLLNGPMKEAQDGYAIWEEVDEQTFIRFSQFVYTGDYLPAPPTQVGEPMEQHRVQRPKAQNAAILWTRFMQDLQYTCVHPPAANFSPLSNQLTDDFSEVLLSHARMYAFADYFGIVTLQTLALHKLRLTLDHFTLYEGKTDEIAGLVRYTYENTPPSSELHGLREHVVVYVASNIDCFWEDEANAMKDLTETCGEFARDLIGMLIKKDSAMGWAFANNSPWSAKKTPAWKARGEMR